MNLSQKKRMCVGCRNDRYNHKGMCERPGIDAVVTSDHCWSLEDAEVIRIGGSRVLACHSENANRRYYARQGASR